MDIRKEKNLARAYKNAHARSRKYQNLLRRPLKIPPTTDDTPPPKLTPHISRAEYEAKVRRIKEFIRAGDCIQVVLSQRFSLPHRGHDFRIYRSLRSINPSPYMFYFRSGPYRLIGSSPEVLVKKTGRTACVRPIAGTRPRGKTEREDLVLEKQLRNSPKEMAEHLMLVDLGRNDLGRVSDFKSVRVENFAYVERYSHVMHLVSNVLSRLKKGKTAADLLKATFPAGTVSGAPKIRAMQIIDELEPESRPYAGVSAIWVLTEIWTCVLRSDSHARKEKCSFTRGGIVNDSNPRVNTRRQSTNRKPC